MGQRIIAGLMRVRVCTSWLGTPSFCVRLDPAALVLAGLFFWFALIHFQYWASHPSRPVGLGLMVLEVLQATLMLVRRRDAGGRRPLSSWLATSIGSWGFLLARPGVGGEIAPLWLFSAGTVGGTDVPWMVVQLSGVLIAIVSLSALGRSFALLPGNRGIRTDGPYRVIRHPAYASYLITDAGYLCENFSLWNAGVFVVVFIAQLARIDQEESFLAADPEYREYCWSVRYRLIPGIF